MKHKPMSETVAQERHVLNYCSRRIDDIKKIKNFLKTHSDDEFEVYSNSHNNFISIKYKGVYETYNGISKEKYEKIYNQVRNNIEEKEEEFMEEENYE